MAICSICRGHHHAASCKHRLKTTVKEPDAPAKPIALNEDELNDIAYRSKEGRQLMRSELDRLIAMARERNALVLKQLLQPASAPAVNAYGYAGP